MTRPPLIYCASPSRATDCLRQGEIVTGLEQFRLRLDTIGTAVVQGDLVRHPYAIIVSQDCDLEQDFRARQGGNAPDKLVPGTLFCEVATAEEVRGKEEMNSTLWRPVPTNKNERYHFLQRVDASCDAVQIGVVELVVDFKRYFTLPTDEVYHRIARGEAKRRCVLVSPYLEHFSTRFAHFLSRVALPQDHASD